ncbi:MAG: phosphoribosylamine--glycine ligase [Pseudomonadota bacterium]
MNVLLIGGGGREHALAWRLAESPKLGTLYCAPGNVGMASLATRVSLDPADQQAALAFCREHEIGLVVIGPEQPLVDGLADTLRKAGIATFGPNKDAAQLEGSKSFTKALCAEHGIPTAGYARFDNASDADDYIRARGAPLVVKADGLAAGKGVVVADTMGDAHAAVARCFDGDFGDAGASVIIEDKLVGEEASFFALVDGETVRALPSAQDHKRAFDGDTGPNTGGMGAYSPARALDDAMADRVMREIIHPTVEAMAARGTPFNGVLYAGLMLTADGPQLIEYNVRFGDPECQVLMLRLETDLLDALHATATGRLAEIALRWSPDPAVTVVLASEGYPGSYEKGSAINGLGAAADEPGVTIFHAGTDHSPTGGLIATGGRVLCVSARAASIRDARNAAYRAVDQIDWPDGFCRRDIAAKALATIAKTPADQSS